MKLLALDAATQACSVALQLGETLLTRYEEPGRGHAEMILPMIDAVLREAGITLRDLDALAVGRGPGTFTGVRIAIGVAQGLAFGADLRVVPVSDLAALAQRVAPGEHADTHTVLACMDARMGEVYWSAYRIAADGLVIPLAPERLSRPEEVEAVGTGCIGVGTGWAAYPQLLKRLELARSAPHAVHGTLLPRAQEVARLAARDWLQGAAVPPEQALPVYLRDKVTHEVSQKT